MEYTIPPHWGACKFDVYRGETELGPWDKVTPTPITSNFFRDSAQDDTSKFNESWYIVEVKLPDGRRIQGPASTWHNKRRNWVEIRAKEIERRESLLLEKFTGVKSMLFKRKHFGMRCRNCWNRDIEKVTQDHCKVCLGTSFEGGYFTGFETLFQYDPDPQAPTLDYRGVNEVNEMTAWTISFPKVDTFDVLLRVPDYRVFRVEKVIPTELQTVMVRQVVQLMELSKESIEYELAAQAMPQGYFL